MNIKKNIKTLPIFLMTFPFHILKILASEEKVDKSDPKCLKIFKSFCEIA